MVSSDAPKRFPNSTERGWAGIDRLAPGFYYDRSTTAFLNQLQIAVAHPGVAGWELILCDPPRKNASARYAYNPAITANQLWIIPTTEWNNLCYRLSSMFDRSVNLSRDDFAILMPDGAVEANFSNTVVYEIFCEIIEAAHTQIRIEQQRKDAVERARQADAEMAQQMLIEQKERKRREEERAKEKEEERQRRVQQLRELNCSGRWCDGTCMNLECTGGNLENDITSYRDLTTYESAEARIQRAKLSTPPLLPKDRMMDAANGRVVYSPPTLVERLSWENIDVWSIPVTIVVAATAILTIVVYYLTSS